MALEDIADLHPYSLLYVNVVGAKPKERGATILQILPSLQILRPIDINLLCFMNAT